MIKTAFEATATNGVWVSEPDLLQFWFQFLHVKFRIEETNTAPARTRLSKNFMMSLKWKWSALRTLCLIIWAPKHSSQRWFFWLGTEIARTCRLQAVVLLLLIHPLFLMMAVSVSFPSRDVFATTLFYTQILWWVCFIDLIFPVVSSLPLLFYSENTAVSWNNSNK